MATFLTWLNILLILYLFSLFFLNRYTRWKGRNITTSLKMDIVKLQKFHKPAGMALLLTGLAHGYLALSNRFVINHSGFVLWVVVLFAVGVGILKENSDNKKLRKVHIQYAILIIVALIYHYFLPGPLI